VRSPKVPNLTGIPPLEVSRHICEINQINVKSYQFKHNVKDDQIIRLKRQISNLLVVELILRVVNGTAFTLMSSSW
jgi:hypothetical protein